MAKFIKMIVVLVCITLASGMALGALNYVTEDRIIRNRLEMTKVPRVIDIMEIKQGEFSGQKRSEIKEGLLNSYKNMEMGGNTYNLFTGRDDTGEVYMVAFETKGEGGYGGEVGVMVGFNVKEDRLEGVGFTSHKETLLEPTFTEEFKKRGLDITYKPDKAGGDIDGITGATMSSVAVCNAVSQAVSLYREHKEEILEKVKQ
jgi:electron transport complex protein RnfG